MNVMTTSEWAGCIKYLNPQALFAIWDDGTSRYVKWDDNHVGAKPTEAECEAVLPIVQAAAKVVLDDASAKAALQEIDLKSIRAIREWVAKQPDVPQFVKDYEAEAVAERAKLAAVKEGKLTVDGKA